MYGYSIVADASTDTHSENGNPLDKQAPLIAEDELLYSRATLVEYFI
jgi:hypothetical protein